MASPNAYSPSRRELLSRLGMGFGMLSLPHLLADGLSAPPHDSTGSRPNANPNPLQPKEPHFPASAKHVIHLFANGGPSHIDTFDPKPELNRWAGQILPGDTPKTERPTGRLMPSPFSFQPRGECGLEVSELFEKVGNHIDDIAVIRSMHADVPNHEPSLMLMNCGDARLVRPSLGSWVTYGLGTENQNLPAYIAMCPGGYPIQESQNWQCGFLPGIFQGTYIDPKNEQIEKLIANVRNERLGTTDQRSQLDFAQKLNQRFLTRHPHDEILSARIESMELAFRMQSEAYDAFDLSDEPQHILDLYGPGVYARQLIIARRLIERGVRFLQLWQGDGQPWDSHDFLERRHRELAKDSDQAIAGLITDLKQRGLFDETLIIWGGEFGRTPTVELPKEGANQGTKTGRDHNHYGFTTWLAGGGVRGGYAHGATDEFGFKAVEKRVHVHDLHATLLHLLGFDHKKLTFRSAGRDFRLTDVHGKVIDEVLA